MNATSGDVPRPPATISSVANAQDDWLFRAVHVSGATGKTIVRAFYGATVHSYFAGCSDGGREGLVEAEQYPADFDGIVAGDPALGNVVIGSNWNEEHLTAMPGNYIPPEKLALLDAAVMQSCDAADGVVDGLVQDPRKCTFDPARLLCTHGDEAGCLTAGQVATLKAIYAGASTADGQRVYSGFTKSDPTGNPSLIIDDGWGLWITGFVSPDAFGAAEPWSDPGLAPWLFTLQDQFLKNFVFSNPNYNSLTFNINSSDLTQAEAVINRSGAAATNPNLAAFRNRGGRLILYHGWSDPALTPLETVRYYKAVARGVQAGFIRTQQFARLFMVPGMRHCIGSGGPGPNVFDPLPSLIDWVENGVAPEQIVAAHFKDNDPTTGIITRTMPLCPYPRVAVFQGGNVNEASNWKCKRQLRDALGDEE